MDVIPYPGGLSGVTDVSPDESRGYFAAVIIDPGTTAVSLKAGLFDSWTNGYDVTAVGAAYSTTSLQSFEFAELNNIGVMAIRHHNYVSTGLSQSTTSAVGYFARSSGVYGSTLTSITGTWIDGISPAFAVCSTVNQFVMGGNFTGGKNGLPYSAGVQWCAIGDATDWPIPNSDDARAKQSGYEQLPIKLGEVTHIGGDDFYAYVWQQTGITKFTYVGGDVVFSVDTFEEARGCYSFGHVARVDDMYFFESKYGRHMIQNDQIVDIGYGLIDDSYPPVHTHGVKVKANPSLHSIFFSNNVVFNYKTQQWTRLPNITASFPINVKAGIIGQYTTGTGTTYLTTSEGGTVETALLTTASPNINPGGRAVVNGVRPIANGGTYAVRVGTLDDIDGTVAWSASTSVNTRSNTANFRAEGRYHRVELTVTGGFTTIMGADVDFTPQGKV